MITFKQYLSEAELPEFVKLIEKDCAEFLHQASQQGLLYRGIKRLSSATAGTIESYDGSEMEYAIKTIRSERRPVDTNKMTHHMIDEFFEKEVGWKPRSQAVFCFGEGASIQDIRRYGEPCIIFPVGPIKYVWSKDIEDLFYDMDSAFGLSPTEESLHRFLKDANYQENGLDDAVTRGHEIMIKCEKYYAFPIEYKREIKHMLGIDR